MTDLTGKTLGVYRIIERIGRGGMATVYRAYHAAMNRDVAIKVLPEEYANDADFRIRFEREAQVVANLRHPYILPVFDYGEDYNISYIVMPYIPTGTLKNFLIENKNIAYTTIIPIIKHLGEALDYAHQKGVIHRDIKPDNVLFDENHNPLLTDFGLTRMMAGSNSLTGTGIIGTPAYMSPEQGQGMQLDHRSDIYSLGIVLYEMVTGDVPFSADTPVAVIFKHVSDPLPMPCSLRSDLPEQAQNVILKALAKTPEDRWESCLAMTSAFVHALKHQPDQFVDTMPAQTDDTNQTVTGIQPIVSPIPNTPTEYLDHAETTVLHQNHSPTENHHEHLSVPTIDDEFARAIADVEPWVIDDDYARAIGLSTSRHTPGSQYSQKSSKPTTKDTQTPTRPNYTMRRIGALAIIIGVVFALAIVSAIDDSNLSSTIDDTQPITTSSNASQDDDIITARTFSGTRNDDWQPIMREFNGVDMALVPAGCFMMGSTRVYDEQPVHEQCFDEPFWIDQFEVTNQQFARFNGTKANDQLQTDDDFPVENITWYEALAFCEERGATLPTEAQWEYAARGVESWEYPWGDEFDASNLVYDNGNTYLSASVGSRPTGVSWVGAYDMLGNVREWTSSLYRPYPSVVAAVDSTSTARRVVRGASWSDFSPVVLRAACRTISLPDDYLYNGFRCAFMPE